ncbi:putative ribonuclease H protein [Senna tora]|uniref:Putative ribonuclease H protein n=1 Tax=Senna tora TaxID=362788 RepID=A0A834SVU4_9FABA|nr:putative ribonuclease H protein [Senna tora]
MRNAVITMKPKLDRVRMVGKRTSQPISFSVKMNQLKAVKLVGRGLDFVHHGA